MAIESYAGHVPTLGEQVYVADSAVVIGKVSLGNHCSVWPMAVIRGDMHTIQIGDYSNIQDNSVLHITHDSEFAPGGYPLTIGCSVTVGHSVVLHGCTIGNHVLIGMHSTVLDGAVIEDEVLIGAASLVPPGKRLTSGYLWFGNPVKQARPLTDSERKFLRYSPQNYAKLKDQYLQDRNSHA